MIQISSKDTAEMGIKYVELKDDKIVYLNGNKKYISLKKLCEMYKIYYFD